MKPPKIHSLLTHPINFQGDSLICLSTGNKSARIVISSISIMNVFLFRAEMPQIVLFQLLNNENLLVVLILYGSKLNIFGYCDIGSPILNFL